MATVIQIEKKIEAVTMKIEKLAVQLKEAREAKATLAVQLKEAKAAEKATAAKAKVAVQVKVAPAKQPVSKEVEKKK